MQRYTRREKIAYQLSEAKRNGKPYEMISLFPSERKKLQKDGYVVTAAIKSDLSVPCKVSWLKEFALYE